jgi:hypothetical protein
MANSEMIERVARAIARCESSDDWEELGQHWKDQFLLEARAAIEAMREPTEAMREAAAYFLGTVDIGPAWQAGGTPVVLSEDADK